MYILQAQGDYRLSYTCLCVLYNRGQFKDESLSVLTEAFYDPNQAEQKERYEANCGLLTGYPQLSRKDFIPFDQLPIRFYPYDDHGYIPYYRSEELFGDYTNFDDEITIRDLRTDAEKATAVTNLYSQYGLEYIRSNLIEKASDDAEILVGLRYTDWGVFCSHLQVLDLRPVLESGKSVFLFDSDKEQK